MLPQFDLLQPKTIAEACDLLVKQAPKGAAILAGGTDILVDIRIPIIPQHLPRCKGCDPKTGLPLKSLDKPTCLIALSRIPELRRIEELPDGRISIGAMVSITDLCNSPLIRAKLTALAEGADNLGSPLVRNRGTLGGNICNARPAADAFIPAVALGANLELMSVRGTRQVPADEFAIGPGKTVRQPDEILTRIIFPALPNKTGSACIKLANRKALEIGVVNVAAVLSLNDAGQIVDVRIALGAVAPTPILAKKAADFLKGKKPTEENFRKAGKFASGECKPITDHRGSALYRIEMVPILVRRGLEHAMTH
ncbi:MAG TPA: xanthine dehydrogenase family protein subunit M [bacterium]